MKTTLALEILGLSQQKLQKQVENDPEVREALHCIYQKIEDALQENCINLAGDLYNETKVQANILTSNAKISKKQGSIFNPSLYLKGYEIYNKKLHGDPIEYLKLHFGKFLASCNKENTDYLWRGDIQLIDRTLYGALYRAHNKKLLLLTNIAGKKSKLEITSLSDRASNKVKRIASTYNNSMK